MGDSGDQGQDTDEFTSDAELDQIARDAEAVQGGRGALAVCTEPEDAAPAARLPSGR